MTPQERDIIDSLFDRLREAEQQSGPREPMAEGHIRSRIESQPGAPYFMAQTIVVQEHALGAAQARIEELERDLAARPAGGGGFLASLFGGGSSSASPPLQPRPDNMQGDAGRPFAGAVPAAGTPWGGSAPGAGYPAGAQPERGSFLGGAAQTAMGVAGGVMLGSLLGSAFGGGQADAAKPQQVADADEEIDAGDL